MRGFVAGLSLVAVLLLGRDAIGTVTEVRAAGATITVTSTADASLLASLAGNGTCDLREAIAAAGTNQPVGSCPAGTAEMDTITFDIPLAGPHTITFAAAMPVILDAVTIDATTAESDTECDVFQGRNLSIILNGGGTKGGLLLSSLADGSQFKGLVMHGFTGFAIDATFANDVVIQCNHIGTNAAGTVAMGNQIGVGITDGGLVGGTNASVARNVISGSTLYGVGVSGAATILNNNIGMNLAGTAALGNGGSGILVFGAGATIGEVNHGNLIGGNSGQGIDTSKNVTIEGNYIGVDYFGQSFPNGGAGIKVTGNATIAQIARNSIGRNTGLGIDLGGDGADPNDIGDADIGPNGRLNHPVITTANQQGHIISLAALPAAAQGYRLDYYISRVCDPSGFGEGERWDRSIEPIAGGTVENSPNPIFGPALTVTATDIATGAVSEFSNCVTVFPDVDCSGQPSAIDALAILRSLAGLGGTPLPVEPCSGNVNGDPFTDIRDAWYVRNYIAQID